MSVVTLSSRVTRSESMEITREEQESDEVEDAEINFRCGAERYVSGRAWNLWYGVINDNPCEPLFMLTLGIFPSLRLLQYLLSMTVALGALSDTSISITSEPSECADPSKRAFLPGS